MFFAMACPSVVLLGDYGTAVKPSRRFAVPLKQAELRDDLRHVGPPILVAVVREASSPHRPGARASSRLFAIITFRASLRLNPSTPMSVMMAGFSKPPRPLPDPKSVYAQAVYFQ
ncbi:MAG: hypothetical protein Q8L61_03455, partial [Hyphomicrobium sp.]|nr:hypothetical protein [Hyphomicrobium sp.]